MATIGTFTAADNGYGGSVKTLTLNFRAKFVPTEKDNDKAPDYRIIAGAIECGAAWKKTARDSDREYLSVKLDDPSFPAPIYASLVKGEGDDSFNLIWSRPHRRLIQRDRRTPPLRRRGFSCAYGHDGAEKREVTFGLFVPCDMRLAKGSALAWARVKHLTVPAGRGVPGLPRR